MNGKYEEVELVDTLKRDIVGYTLKTSNVTKDLRILQMCI